MRHKNMSDVPATFTVLEHNGMANRPKRYSAKPGECIDIPDHFAHLIESHAPQFKPFDEEMEAAAEKTAALALAAQTAPSNKPNEKK